jgi:hypothetical protein
MLLFAQNSIFAPDLLNQTNNINTLLNPYKLKMSHSMGFSAGTSSNGLGFYQSRYTNHLQYDFSPKLNMAIDLNFVNFGSTSQNKSWSIQSNDDNKSRILPEFSLTYKPSDAFTLQVEYRNLSNQSPWLGYPSDWNH